MPKDSNSPQLITDISENEISEFWNGKNKTSNNSEIYELLGFNTSINDKF